MFSSSRALASPLPEQVEPLLFAQRVMWEAAFAMDTMRGPGDAFGHQGEGWGNEAVGAFEDEAPIVSY
jgi:hypothetical protein